jgi:hypothetical protein
MHYKQLAVLGMALLLVMSGCNQEKPRDPNLIETKLADGRALEYTKQQLSEAQSWGYTKDAYDAALAQGHTHGELIEITKRHYWERAHGAGFPTPQEGITPPPEMRVTH